MHSRGKAIGLGVHISRFCVCTNNISNLVNQGSKLDFFLKISRASTNVYTGVSLYF